MHELLSVVDLLKLRFKVVTMKLHVVGCLLLLLTAVSVLPAPAATVSDRVESRAQTLDSSKVYTTPLCGGDNCKSASGFTCSGGFDGRIK